MKLRNGDVCPVCLQTYDAERARATSIAAGLFGAAPYAVCPLCGQEVPRPWSDEYRERHDRELALPTRDAWEEANDLLGEAHQRPSWDEARECYDQAIACLRRGLDERPDDDEFLWLLATAHKERAEDSEGQPEGAEDDRQEAARLFERVIEIRRPLLGTSGLQDDLSDFIHTCIERAETDPATSRPFLKVALDVLQCDDLSLDGPPELVAVETLLRLYRRTMQPLDIDQAAKMSRRTVAAMPASAKAHELLGICLHEQFLDAKLASDAIDETLLPSAVAAYREATRLNPAAVDLYVRQADALADLGLHKEARQLVAWALIKFPGDEALRALGATWRVAQERDES